MDTPKLIPIIALEDDASFAETLRMVLESTSEFVLTKAFRNPVHFLSELPNLSAEVFLVDVNLPRLSGLDCVKEILREHPKSRVIILTVHDSDEFVLKAFLHGADGYVLKDEAVESIHEAIHEALRGGAPMSPAIARMVVRLLADLQSNPPEATEEKSAANRVVAELLTPREYEILECLAQGDRYKEIASKLFVSVDTVKTHIRHIYEKLHVRNKAEAVARFLR